MVDARLARTVEVIRETVADWSANHLENGGGFGQRALIVLAVFEVELERSADGKLFWSYDPFYADMFAREAACHWDVHRCYRKVVASKMDAGKSLFPDERAFAVGLLDGTLEAPKKPKARKLEDQFTRNLLILDFIEWLHTEHGLARFRVEGKATDKPDGPSIVSEAFALAGHHEVTPGAIKGVLQNRDFAAWADKLHRAKNGASLKKSVSAALLSRNLERDLAKYAELGGLSRQ